MDLYQSLIDDDELLDYFCDILEDNISKKKGYRVNIMFQKYDISIFFFLEGQTKCKASSILQIMPDKDLQYKYAHVPYYEDQIQHSINIFEKQYRRDRIIDHIIKRES